MNFANNALNLCRKDLTTYFRHLFFRASQQRKKVFFHSNSLIRAKNESFTFCQGCTIGSFTIIDVSDAPVPQTNKGYLHLGTNVFVGDHCNIRAAGAEISIGNDTMIANGVTIIGTNHKTGIGIPLRLQPWDMERSGIKIGEDCWIGAGSIILPGAIISDGAIIAAGSVVRGFIPERSIVAGVPAHFRKMR